MALYLYYWLNSEDIADHLSTITSGKFHPVENSLNRHGSLIDPSVLLSSYLSL